MTRPEQARDKAKPETLQQRLFEFMNRDHLGWAERGAGAKAQRRMHGPDRRSSRRGG